jgi:hypothetical protein
VWGVCTYASGDRDRGMLKRKAEAVCCDALVDAPADFETRHDFGCVAWESLAKAVKDLPK